METWKAIRGLEGAYEVSDLGNVRRLEHFGRGRYGKSMYPAKPVKVTFSERVAPYKYVTAVVSLPYSAGRKTVPVSWLVADTFLSARAAGLEVCHNNGDSTDNRACNLRYGTHAENMSDTVRHGTSIRGMRHPMRKLDEASAAVLKARIATCPKGGKSALAKEFGVSPQTIANIIRGRAWGWLDAANL